MSVRTRQGSGRRGADAVRGLGALVGIVVLVAGVPVGLIAAIGSPLPAHVPKAGTVARALGDGDIPDTFLIKALAVVCWLVWFELVTSLVVEALAYARGRRAGAVPLAGAVQRGAARLVAAVALLGALTIGRSAPGPAPSVAPWSPVARPVSTMVVAEAPQSVSGAAHAPDASPQPTPPASRPVYEVQRRDTLWDIAERHLGDPFRWREIYDLNRGRPQSDGTRLTDPDLIYVGWRLELPPDAVGLAPRPAPEPTPAPEPVRVPSHAPPPTGADQGPGGGGGGMVLIEEGATGDDVTLASGVSAPGGTAAGDPGGLVLLPDGAFAGGPVSDAQPELADSRGGSQDDDPRAGDAGSVMAGLRRPGPPNHP